jgi:hypothetical protein
MLNAVPRAAILAFLLCLSAKSSGVFAQGSLQFNQVLLVNTLDTVPANKVWKIEALAYNGGAPFASQSASYSFIFNGTRGFDCIARFLINGNPVVIPTTYLQNNFNSTSGANFPFSFPMWLPAGTTLNPQTNISYLSVIEFNVIP